MRWIITHVIILLKLHLRRITGWLWALILALAILLVRGAVEEAGLEPVTALCPGSDPLALSVCQELMTYSGYPVEFIRQDDAQRLEEGVITGRYICGFVFPEDLTERLAEGERRDLIRCVESPYATGTALAKEHVSAAFFKHYTGIMLQEMEPDIFETEDSEREDALKAAYEYYLDSDAVFDLDIQRIGQEEGAEKEAIASGRDRAYMAAGGLGAIFLFLLIYINHKNAGVNNPGYLKALDRRRLIAYGLIDDCCAGLLPAVVCILMTGRPLQVLLVLVLSTLWNTLISLPATVRLGGVGGGFDAGQIFVLSALCLFLCPIITDLAEYIPAVAVLRLLLPPGWYFL